MEVYLDIDPQDGQLFDNKKTAEMFMEKFQPILNSIGGRIKKSKKIAMSYPSPSVWLFEQAKDLHFLGYFVSSIIVCRTVVENLAYEIFYEEVELEGDDKLIESVADNLDFRKIVNEFLYNPKKGCVLISKESHELFNSLYTEGNEWIHPRKTREKTNIENRASNVLEGTQSLISSLRDVLKEFDVSEGKFIKKTNSRKKVRPVILETNYI